MCIMKRDYLDPAYKQFRIDVLKRDNFKCRMPSCNSTKNLNVHHINPWSKAASLRYDISNGITLCKKCHIFIHGQEHHYSKLFREIIDG